jgi:hypothetical protein
MEVFKVHILKDVRRFYRERTGNRTSLIVRHILGLKLLFRKISSIPTNEIKNAPWFNWDNLRLAWVLNDGLLIKNVRRIQRDCVYQVTKLGF